MFTHSLRVRFQDVDAAGIVFYAQFFVYAHEAFEEWMRDAGLTISEMLNSGDLGMPLVHAEADYRSPVRHDDLLEIGVEVERLSERSVSFRIPIRGANGGEKAVVRTTHACIDRKTFESVAWPAAQRSLLESVASKS